MKSLPAAIVLLLVTPVLGDDEIFTDPAEAGPDYAVQGEYSGNLSVDGETTKFGLQVIALGDGAFDAVGYVGGLPGDGWNQKKKIAASGETVDGVTVLKSEEGSATIKGDTATIEVDGNVLGKLKKVVRKSTTLGAKAPKGAVVLFDGTTADHFEGGKIVAENLLAADCATKEKFGDHTLHIEFRTPFKPKARGQGRGNSGVYIQSRYECQVLDSFGLNGENNECGGIYQIGKPAVNMCFPPPTWQTYDIDFTAARWEDGKKVKNARVTIRHNGVVIHDDLELPKNTPGKHGEADSPDGIYLQGHGNPVVYRNIWLVRK